jgi:hypothetical protein
MQTGDSTQMTELISDTDMYNANSTMDSSPYSDNWVAPPEELPAAQVAAITIGDAVKISNGRERFFVIVTGVGNSASAAAAAATGVGNSATAAAVVGRIDNALVRAAPYGYGDSVIFQRRHVWQIHDAASRCALAAHLSTQLTAATANGVSPRTAVRALMQTARIVDCSNK